MASESLINYNINGALDNMLAMEEHLSETGVGVPHTWCQAKHGKLCSSHHLRELIEHSAGEDPTFSKQVSEFKVKFDDARTKNVIDIDEIRNLRNNFREIIGDPTLSQSKEQCGVCALDKAKKSGLNVSAMAVPPPSDTSSSPWPWIIGGAVALGVVILLVRANKN